MHCEEAERLLDGYLAALGAFYDARKPSLMGWLRGESNVDLEAATRTQLVAARRQYWTHLDECRLGEPREERRFVRGRVLRREPGWTAVRHASETGY